MSNITLNANAGGTGIFTIASPNSNTNRTLTLPDASGTFFLNSTNGALNVNSAAPANSLVVDGSGNVGIGTSSPGYRLEVNSGSNAFPARLTTTATNSLLVVGDSGTTGLGPCVGSSGNSLIFGRAGVAEYARIDSSGNLLVNTTSQFSTGRICVLGGSSTSIGLVTRSITDGNFAIGFQNTVGTFVGNVTVNASTTNYNTSSDYRLKENIQPMTGALAKVAALKPVTYKWKVDGSDGEGFIAHELAEVVPGCVTGEKDEIDAEGNPQYQGIDTSFLVATLTAAIQEQQAIIEQLTTRIAALEAR